uniref:Uncharacterized protein n=1 Tax=Arundo donax TaxID=35708 RepID=A0A0A9A7R0_ARUDO
MLLSELESIKDVPYAEAFQLP